MLAALLAVGSSAPRVPLLLYNRTPSMPTGFYLRVGDAPGRGDVVAFRLPGSAWEYAQRRGEPTDLVLLKHVLAVGGDSVRTTGGRLSVNGVDFGPIPVVDSTGRALPQWRADRVLAPDELLAGSTRPRSFDGRFFGPIRLADVIGVYRRVGVGIAAPGIEDGETIDGAKTPASSSGPRDPAHCLRPSTTRAAPSEEPPRARPSGGTRRAGTGRAEAGSEGGGPCSEEGKIKGGCQPPRQAAGV